MLTEVVAALLSGLLVFFLTKRFERQPRLARAAEGILIGIVVFVIVMHFSRQQSVIQPAETDSPPLQTDVPPKPATAPEPQPVLPVQGSRSPTQDLPSEEALTEENRRVSEDGSTTFLGGALYISLIRSDLAGPDLIRQVTATISAPSAEPIQLSNVTVGHVVTYEGFEVRLMGGDAGSATFNVRRLPSVQ